MREKVEMPLFEKAVSEVEEHRVSFEIAAVGYAKILTKLPVHTPSVGDAAQAKMAAHLEGMAALYCHHGREMFANEEGYEEVGLVIAGLARLITTQLDPTASAEIYQ